MIIITTKFNRNLIKEVIQSCEFWEEIVSLGKDLGTYQREANSQSMFFFQNLTLYLELKLWGKYPVFVISKKYLNLFIYLVFIYLGAFHAWMSEDNLRDVILSSYLVGPSDELSLSAWAASSFTCSAILLAFM